MATEYIHKKFSQLPPAAPATGVETFPVNQGTTKAGTLDWIAEFIGFGAEAKSKLADLPTATELGSALSSISGDVGDKTLLTTTVKTDTVSAINEVAASVPKRTVSESAPTGIPRDGEEWIMVT